MRDEDDYGDLFEDGIDDLEGLPPSGITIED